MEKEDGDKKYTPIDSNNAVVAKIPTLSADVHGPGELSRSADTNTMEETGEKKYRDLYTSNRKNDPIIGKTRLMPKLTDIVAYFKEYCDAGGLHGIRYLSEDRRNYFEKIFWFTTLIMCAVGCALMIVKVKRKLDTTPVVVTFAESETNIWHLPFPAVTICPYTKFNPSLFNFTKFASKFEKNEDFYDDYESYLKKIESKIEVSDRLSYYMNGNSTWIKENFSKRLYNDSYGDDVSEEVVALLEQMLLNNNSHSSRGLVHDVCNSTSFSQDVSPIEDNKLCTSIREYYVVWINEIKQKLLALGPVCGLYYLWWQRVFKNTSFILDERAPNFLKKIALSGVDFGGLWNSEFIPTPDNWKEIWTPEGRCFTFNMINNGQIYNEDVLSVSQELLNKSETSNDWHPDTGYSTKAGPDTYPRRSSFADQYSGLRLGLMEDTEQIDLLCNSGFTGYKIILHRPDDYPQGHLHYDVDIPFNKHASIAINPIVMTTSPELEHYDAHKRQCYLSHEKNLEYFRFYTKNNCLLECLTKATLKKCGCVAFYMPRNSSTKMCGTGLHGCISAAARELEARALDEHLKEVSEDGGGTFNSALTKMECDCLPTCLSITYEADASIVERDLAQILKVKSSISNTIILINYQNGHFIANRRSELYGTIDFLANCGGLLGLFCGFSIISLIEFVYFITIRLWTNIIRRWTTNRKIHKIQGKRRENI